MSKPRLEWTSNIGSNLRRSQVDFDQPKYKKNYEYSDDLFGKDRDPNYNTNARSTDRDGLDYKASRSPRERYGDIERDKILEDFKYNVAKNCTATEKKVYKALELNNDEILKLNSKVDLLNKRMYDSKPVDPDDIKEYIDRKLFDINQKNNSAYSELEEQNQGLLFQLDNLK